MHCQQAHNVGMVQFLQVPNLAVGLLRVGCVAKRLVYFFERTGRPCFFIASFPHLPVCTLAHLLQDLEIAKHAAVDCVVHLLLHGNKILSRCMLEYPIAN